MDPDSAGLDEQRGVPAPAAGFDHVLTWSQVGRRTLRAHLGAVIAVLLVWFAGTAVLIVRFGTGGASPAGELALQTATFLPGCLAVLWAVRRLRRPWWSVVAGRWPGPVRHFAVGAGVALAACLVVDLASCLVVPLRVVGFQPAVWFPLLLVGALGFLAQTGFEELLFRGLGMQAVASRTARAWLVVGLPALVFAALHWGNLPAYGSDPLQLVPYLLLGLTFGWTVWWSGSLWLAFGLHWANNLYATVAVTTVGDVLPTGAPLARDLADVPLWLLTTMIALQCALQVLAVRALTPRVPVTGLQTVASRLG